MTTGETVAAEGGDGTGGAPARESTLERVAHRYSLFYPPIAVVVFVLAFLPLYQDVIVDHGDRNTTTRHFGTVFNMAGTPAGAPAILGILLLFGLVVILVASTFRGTSAVLPGVTAVLAALIALLLLTKPATGDPAPGITDPGTAGVALLICTAVLTCVHAIHIAASRRKNRPAATPDQK